MAEAAASETFSSMAGSGFDFGIGAAHDARMRNQARARFKKDRGVNFAREDAFQQKIFDREDSSIQRRVSDARAAGVHPLFALGASFPSGGGSVASAYQMDDGGTNFDASGMGRSLGKLASGESKMASESHAAGLAESEARTRMYNAQTEEFTAKAAAASVTARSMQNANVQQDLIKLTPDSMASAQSSDPSVSAGKNHPAYRQYTVTQDGLSMDLPYSEEGPSEALENIPFYLWPAIIQHNRVKYGGDWGTRFFNEFVMGKSRKYGTRGVSGEW